MHLQSPCFWLTFLIQKNATNDASTAPWPTFCLIAGQNAVAQAFCFLHGVLDNLLIICTCIERASCGRIGRSFVQSRRREKQLHVQISLTSGGDVLLQVATLLGLKTRTCSTCVRISSFFFCMLRVAPFFFRHAVFLRCAVLFLVARDVRMSGCVRSIKWW